MLTSNQRLEQQIENLIREHLAACRRAATAAVEGAFEAAMSEPAPAKRRTKTTPRTPRPRRTPEELEILTEYLYAEVCAAPGETMAVLAAQLEMSPRSLQIPAARLKRAGLVRTVGQRAHTRYFPMSKDKTVAKTPLVVVGSES